MTTTLSTSAVQAMATQLRVDSILCSTAAGSGHPSSSMSAADQLAADGFTARVLDAYSVKPIDADALIDAAARTGHRLVVVEDHYRQGGLGSAVLEALADAAHPPRVVQLAVPDVPGSGSPAEVIDAAGITAPHIVAAARRLADAA